MSFFVAPNDTLCFRLFANDGRCFENTVPLEKVGILYGAPVYLAFELGFAETYTFMSIEVNGSYIADRRLDQAVFDGVDAKHIVFGSDVIGEAASNFRVKFYGVASQTMTFAQRLETRAWKRWLALTRLRRRNSPKTSSEPAQGAYGAPQEVRGTVKTNVIQHYLLVLLIANTGTTRPPRPHPRGPPAHAHRQCDVAEWYTRYVLENL